MEAESLNTVIFATLGQNRNLKWWEECPSGCDMRGAEIPEELRNTYISATHWTRIEGVILPQIDQQGPAYYRCPDCKVTWHAYEENTIERAQVQELWGECHHVDTWFDRTFCPEPCGSMHTICTDCGEIFGGCVLNNTEGEDDE